MSHPPRRDRIKNWVAIQEKYGDPSKAELTFNVKSGQPMDIDLK